jgi:hypothetical protein
MTGGDLLHYFERIYYRQLPGGWFLRYTRAIAGAISGGFEKIKTRVRLFWKIKIAKRVDVA